MKLFGKFCLLLLVCCNTLLAQKKPIDTSVYGNWPIVNSPEISPDGNYVSYATYYGTKGLTITKIKSTKREWEISENNIRQFKFTGDSRYVLYQHATDGLVCRLLGSDSVLKFSNVISSQTVSTKKGELLILLRKDHSLLIHNLYGGNERVYKATVNYCLSKNGEVLAIESISDEKVSDVNIVTLEDFKSSKVYSGEKVEKMAFDTKGKILAIASTGSIWIYESSIGDIYLAFKNGVTSRDNIKIANGPVFRFSSNGRVLYFEVEEVARFVRDSNAVRVDIWSHTDTKIQPRQLEEVNGKELYLSSFNLKEKKFHKLLNKGESMVPGMFTDENDQFVLAEYSEGASLEYYWNPVSAQTTFIISGETGERINVKENAKARLNRFSFSPGSQFLVFFDPNALQYFSLNTTTKVFKNITKNIATNWSRYDTDEIYTYRDQAIGIAGWMEGGKGVLINDANDIWILDPMGEEKPVNLTASGQRESKKCMIFTKALHSDKVFRFNSPFFLKVHDLTSRRYGFCTLTIAKSGKALLSRPELSDHTYSLNADEYTPIGELKKAETSDRFLVKRESVVDYPNFYYTEDFKSYKPMSRFDPHSYYKWVRKELHHVPLREGGNTLGILIKPEDFDSTKRYPVIIYFYEKLAYSFNVFPFPTLGAVVDVPYFVGNDYLVFMPDIAYKNYKGGKAALETVESAYSYLASKIWVDSNNIGINGHSFGGYEANFIATRSSKFKAIITGAGISNLVSEFGTLREGDSRAGRVENGLYRMYGTPWENKQDYVDASPVFHVDKTKSPILIFHDKDDGAISFTHSIEFFMNLRRAGKRVWLLQYDGEGHTISSRNRNAGVDQQVRFIQFFDHYLKGKPAPKWMTKGIPAKMKGVDSGLELDQNGSCGDSCAICHPELKKGK